jgi:hypothetical protein
MLVFKQILQAAAFRQAMISQFVVQFDTTWALSMCGWCCQQSIACYSIGVSAAIQWPKCWAAGAASFAGGPEWAGTCPWRVLLNGTACNVVGR